LYHVDDDYFPSFQVHDKFESYKQDSTKVQPSEITDPGTPKTLNPYV